MGWGERLNDILLIQSATWQNLMLSHLVLIALLRCLDHIHLKPKFHPDTDLSLSLSLYFSFGISIFCEIGIYKTTSFITWKTNIEWRKTFIFEIKSGKVQEVVKGGGAKSLNFLHLWLKLVIGKKIDWGERLNNILLIQIQLIQRAIGCGERLNLLHACVYKNKTVNIIHDLTIASTFLNDDIVFFH